MAVPTNVYTDKFDSFNRLSNKLTSLAYSKTDGYKKTLQTILDEFNSLDFDSRSAKNHNRAVLVINHFCSLVPPDESDLVRKTCQLFENLMSNNELKIEGKTLSVAVGWCLECLRADVNVPVLKCLQALIRSNTNMDEYSEQIISQLAIVIKTDDQTAVLHCLKCIRSIVIQDSIPSEKNALECLRLFGEFLFAENASPDEILRCKCTITAMKGLGNAVTVLGDVGDRLGDLLGISKSYMFYGLPGHKEYRVEKLYPSRVTVPENLRSVKADIRKPKGKYDRKSKKVNLTLIGSLEKDTFSSLNDLSDSLDLICSDSDFSDLEGDNTKTGSVKVRLCALILLQALIQKIGTKTFLNYLPCFLSDGLDNLHTRTLMTCVLKDPSSKCRFEASGILSTIISDSKQYFFQANSATKSSFTSLACNIGSTIKELHKCLSAALVSEASSTVLPRLLKCASDLIRCSPYYKLESGLITGLADRVKPYLKHKDVNVRISALNVFGCIVSVEPKTQEVNDLVMSSRETQKPWLFEMCLSSFSSRQVFNSALAVESLQVLGALVRNYIRQTLITFPNDIIFVLDYCSKKPEYPIRLYSGKLIETILGSLQYNLSSGEENEREFEGLIASLWNTLLKGPITKLIHSDKEAIKCTGCDCIANVGVQITNVQSSTVQNSFIFDLLQRDSQILCITYLFACARDDSAAVRSSAIRALAIFVLFPSLKEDGLFLSDTIDVALSSAIDEHNNVRAQSAWLLGNVTEALASNKAADFDDGVTDSAVLNMLHICIQLAGDAPKIRPGALRAIGNLLSIFDRDRIENNKEQVARGIGALLKNAAEGSFMKARWNSCYAVANVLRNPFVLAAEDWTVSIIDAMTSLLQNYKNFKVRIGAGCALTVPPDRRHYRDRFHSVWKAVFSALDNSKNIADYSEYQHRDQLIDQLCLVMCHLSSLLEFDDLLFLGEAFNHHLDSVQYHMKLFQSRIVPEKSDLVLKALDKISGLIITTPLKTKQYKTLEMLRNLFADDR